MLLPGFRQLFWSGSIVKSVSRPVSLKCTCFFSFQASKHSTGFLVMASLGACTAGCSFCCPLDQKVLTKPGLTVHHRDKNTWFWFKYLAFQTSCFLGAKPLPVKGLGGSGDCMERSGLFWGLVGKEGPAYKDKNAKENREYLSAFPACL